MFTQGKKVADKRLLGGRNDGLRGGVVVWFAVLRHFVVAAAA